MLHKPHPGSDPFSHPTSLSFRSVFLMELYIASLVQVVFSEMMEDRGGFSNVRARCVLLLSISITSPIDYYHILAISALNSALNHFMDCSIWRTQYGS